MNDNAELQRLQQNWERLGIDDPMWAVMYDPTKREQGWQADEFFATGQHYVDDLIARLTAVGVELGGRRVLDFGCGVGRLTRPLATHYTEAVGVDVAPSMVEAATQWNAEITNCRFVLNGSADLSQFDDNAFDLVHSRLVLQHMAPELSLGYMREFVRITEAGGYIVFDHPSSPVAGRRGFFHRNAPRALMNLYRRLRYRDGAVMEMHWIDPERIIAHMKQAGAQVVHDTAIPAIDGAHVVKHFFCFQVTG